MLSGLFGLFGLFWGENNQYYFLIGLGQQGVWEYCCNVI
jgi:hypothetical protein